MVFDFLGCAMPEPLQIKRSTSDLYKEYLEQKQRGPTMKVIPLGKGVSAVHHVSMTGGPAPDSVIGSCHAYAFLVLSGEVSEPGFVTHALATPACVCIPR